MRFNNRSGCKKRSAVVKAKWGLEKAREEGGKKRGGLREGWGLKQRKVFTQTHTHTCTEQVSNNSTVKS